MSNTTTKQHLGVKIKWRKSRSKGSTHGNPIATLFVDDQEIAEVLGYADDEDSKEAMRSSLFSLWLVGSGQATTASIYHPSTNSDNRRNVSEEPIYARMLRLTGWEMTLVTREEGTLEVYLLTHRGRS